ncbi:T9SS type A sorting domain-containing protein, partial [Candidatus Latescibacterota bacterium]
FLELAELIDVYFITHPHEDHFSVDLINAVKDLYKPVIGPSQTGQWFQDLITIGMEAGIDTTLTINGLDLIITAHDGLHYDGKISSRQFEITTPEGFKVFHGGDNQEIAMLPAFTHEEVDVFLFNSTFLMSPDSEGKFYTEESIQSVREAINTMQPKVALPGHMMELYHLPHKMPTPPYFAQTYQWAFDYDNGTLIPDYHVLCWGERYHFDDSSNDSKRPNRIENLSTEIQGDNIKVSWDNPKIAEDGDTASFYRVIVNDADDYFVNGQDFNFVFNAPAFNNFKVYSYDDSGNQSETYAEIDVTVIVTDVETAFPKQPKLLQNYPNPFNPATTIEYSIPLDGHVILAIYNISGQRITVLSDEYQQAGKHSVTWNSKDLPNGLFFCTLKANGFSETRTMVLVK